MTHSTRRRRCSMREFTHHAVVALAALVLAGCGNATSPTQEARAARARWVRTRPVDYGYVLTRSCYCLDEVVRPVRIEVRGAVVASRTYVASGAAVDAKWADFFPSIDGLFVTLGNAGAQGQSVEATYDGQYGYPRTVAIDREHWAVDGGSSLAVTDFHPLP